MNYPIILRNALITPDGTTLESKYQHDYQSHLDSVTGETYSIDGGLDYFRTSINKVPATCKRVTINDPFEMQREAFTWGSYGKNGDEPLHYVKLMDMTDLHIWNILQTQKQIKGTYTETLFKQELNFRAEEQEHINEIIGYYDDDE